MSRMVRDGEAKLGSHDSPTRGLPPPMTIVEWLGSCLPLCRCPLKSKVLRMVIREAQIALIMLGRAYAEEREIRGFKVRKRAGKGQRERV